MHIFLATMKLPSPSTSATWTWLKADLTCGCCCSKRSLLKDLRCHVLPGQSGCLCCSITLDNSFQLSQKLCMSKVNRDGRMCPYVSHYILPVHHPGEMDSPWTKNPYHEAYPELPSFAWEMFCPLEQTQSLHSDGFCWTRPAGHDCASHKKHHLLLVMDKVQQDTD